jgi:hypothetical protein
MLTLSDLSNPGGLVGGLTVCPKISYMKNFIAVRNEDDQENDVEEDRWRMSIRVWRVKTQDRHDCRRDVGGGRSTYRSVVPD